MAREADLGKAPSKDQSLRFEQRLAPLAALHSIVNVTGLVLAAEHLLQSTMQEDI